MLRRSARLGCERSPSGITRIAPRRTAMRQRARPQWQRSPRAGGANNCGGGKQELFMADQPQQPEVIDPDNVPETLCEGMFNVSFAGPNAVITFTHIRP